MNCDNCQKENIPREKVFHRHFLIDKRYTECHFCSTSCMHVFVERYVKDEPVSNHKIIGFVNYGGTH